MLNIYKLVFTIPKLGSKNPSRLIPQEFEKAKILLAPRKNVKKTAISCD